MNETTLSELKKTIERIEAKLSNLKAQPSVAAQLIRGDS